MVAISAMEQRRLETEKIIPIRKAVLGEWKMVEYQNWEDVRSLRLTFKLFSENLKFELVDGKMKQSGAGLKDVIEGENGDGAKKLYVEDDHLKTILSRGHTQDIYIQNGRLHHAINFCGVAFKRIYENNGGSRMAPIKLEEQMSASAPQRPVPEEKTENLTKKGSQKNKNSWDFGDYIGVFLAVVGVMAVAMVFVAPIYTSLNNPVPIKEDIEGSWKLVDHMNYEGYQKANSKLNFNFEKFSENLRFDTLPDGRLVQTGGGSPQIIEDSTRKMILYEEDNHLKSYKTDYSTEDRFVEDGKLIRIDFFEEGVTKRVYERI